MFSLNTGLLKKKFAIAADADYPDQEVYPNLPADTDGQWQPFGIGWLASEGTTLQQIFLSATPTVVIDLGTDNGDGTYNGRKFKVFQRVTNPETGFVHGMQAGYTVLRYQNKVVTTMTVSTNYTLSENNTIINFNPGANGKLDNDAEIRVVNNSISGAGWSLLDDPAGTFTGTATGGIYAVCDVIHFLLVCMANVPTSKLDMSSFTLMGVNKQGWSGNFTAPAWFTSSENEMIRAYHEKQIAVQEFIDELAFSIGHKLIVNSAGIYSLRQLQTYARGFFVSRGGVDNSTSTLSVIDADIDKWEELLTLDSFINRIIVRYFQIPGGAQETEFSVIKRKRKKRYKTETMETEAFKVRRNKLTKVINGITVKDDLLFAIGFESTPFEVKTYWITATPAQDLADYLYLQWGRGNWHVKFTDISGTLTNAVVADLVDIHRARSAYGDISTGKTYRIIDATARLSNNTTDVSRADEVKL